MRREKGARERWASNRLIPVLPAGRVMGERRPSDDFSGLIQNDDLVLVLGLVDASEMGEFIPVFHVFAFLAVSCVQRSRVTSRTDTGILVGWCSLSQERAARWGSTGVALKPGRIGKNVVKFGNPATIIRGDELLELFE